MYCLVDQGIVYFWMWFTTTSEKIFSAETLKYKKTVTEHSCHFKYDAICQNCRTYATRYCHSCQKDIFPVNTMKKVVCFEKKYVAIQHPGVTFWCTSIFHYTQGAYTNGMPNCVCLVACAVHHLASTLQPWGHTRKGQVFTFSRGGIVEYCASQNATSVWYP